MKNFKFQKNKACPAKLERSGGFTLIELLIVIAIMGIISSIIIYNLSQSRAKAYDAQVKIQLRGFRAAAENYYTSQIPVTYGPAASDCTTGLFNDVDPKNGSPKFYIQSSALPNNTQVFCGSTDEPNSAFAVIASLYKANEYWCVDNKGFAGLYAGVPANGISFCQ